MSFPPPELAILFWFYLEPELCLNRLELLRKFNRSSKVFGLYGGPPAEAIKYQTLLEPLLDDFYCSPFEDKNWKWLHGDLTILDWYSCRGRSLSWDSIVVIQWDLLLFDDINRQFAGIQKNQLCISDLGELEAEDEVRWSWTQPGTEKGEQFVAFCKYVQEKYKYTGKFFHSLFVVVVFPRVFFEKYLTVEHKELGFLEYKLPTYARIFGIPFFERDFGVQWLDVDNGKTGAINADHFDIPAGNIHRELMKPKGRRMFHPYYKSWPLWTVKCGTLLRLYRLQTVSKEDL